MEENQENQESIQDKSPDAIEALATEIGWRPDGELDAKEYILKSRDIQDTMREHMAAQKKQISEFGKTVEELKAHNERVYKAEVKQLKSELDVLKKEKREAIEEGDADRVDSLDEKIDGLKEEISKPQPKQKPVSTEFDEWVLKNPWYEKDDEMAAFADSIAEDYKGAPFKKVAVIVEKRVKELYPEKFEKPKDPTPKPSPVEGAGKKISGQKFTKADLTPSQRQIMKEFVSLGVMTEEQYIADIAKSQGE